MQRWTKVFAAAGLAVIASVANPVLAQQPGGGGGRGGRGGPGGGMMGGRGGMTTVFSVLRSEAVQKEIALTDDQKTKATKLGEELQAAVREAMPEGLFGGPGGGGGGGNSEERDKKMAEFREKTSKITADKKTALAAIVSADQMKRLEEIVLQVKGAEALNEADIQSKLAVNEEQKAKLASVNKDFDEKLRGTFQRPQGGGGNGGFDREAFAAAMEKRNAVQKEKDTALVAVLTPAQAEQFDMMKGKEFADIASVRNAGFGGGRGPGGPGGDRGGNRPNRPATEN